MWNETARDARQGVQDTAEVVYQNWAASDTGNIDREHLLQRFKAIVVEKMADGDD